MEDFCLFVFGSFISCLSWARLGFVVVMMTCASRGSGSMGSERPQSEYEFEQLGVVLQRLGDCLETESKESRKIIRNLNQRVDHLMNDRDTIKAEKDELVSEGKSKDAVIQKLESKIESLDRELRTRGTNFFLFCS